MIFDKEDFDAFDPVEDQELASSKLEQVKSFARYVVSNPNVIETLGLEYETKLRLMDNLVYWHEKEDLFEMCHALMLVKKDLVKEKK
jgi:hypothetical protein